MMIDGLLSAKIADNLNNKLQKGKIQRIYQINDNELLFKIRANQVNYQLFNSINSNNFRLHLTNQQYSTLETATNFTMVLRKYLEGGIIKKIYQYECERTIIMEIVKINELRDEQTRYLIFELLGRHSNTILCQQDLTIIQPLKFIPLSHGLTRIIHQGLKYEFVDHKNKLNPLLTIQNCIDYQKQYQGFSNYLNQEFIFQNQQGQTAQTLLNKYLNSTTVYVYPKIISFLPLEHLNDEYLTYPDLDLAFDSTYQQTGETNSINNIFKKELKEIKGSIKKNNNKIIKLQQQIIDNQDYEKHQKKGTLLYDNLYQFDKNQHYDKVKIFDYETNQEIEIQLNPLYSYTQNAQLFLKTYHKIKKSFAYLEVQIKEAQQQNKIYHNVLETVEYAKVNDITELFDELKQQRLLRATGNFRKRKSNKKPKYEVYYSHDNTTILVGKNNIQNDYITFKLADKNDFWLHIKNQAGAHVIIRSDNPSNQTLEDAAKLAIFFSKTQPNVNYEVDYTQIKNLKKIKGSKLGEVTFTNNNSLLVANEPNIIKQLKRGI